MRQFYVGRFAPVSRRRRQETLVTKEGRNPSQGRYVGAFGEKCADTPSVSWNQDGLSGRHILVVDDVHINLQLLEVLLSERGAWVTIATHGQEALDLLRVHPRGWDIVLMDIRMPGMDGFETTRRIRTELGLRDLPIIACTSELLPLIWHELVEAGFDEYQPKPIDVDDLITTLLRWIEPASGRK